MGNRRASLDTIENFLAQKRIAMVGISREPKTFSGMLFEEFCRRGYDMVPVNPMTPQVLGRSCFARVQEIHPPVDAAILLTSPGVCGCIAPAGRVRSATRRSSSAAPTASRSLPENARICSGATPVRAIACMASSARSPDATRVEPAWPPHNRTSTARKTAPFSAPERSSRLPSDDPQA